MQVLQEVATAAPFYQQLHLLPEPKILFQLGLGGICLWSLPIGCNPLRLFSCCACELCVSSRNILLRDIRGVMQFSN
jgi:hypothetical protein